MAVFPNEFTKTYQDAWLKAVNAAVHTMQTASQTASNNADDVKKSAHAFDPREGA
jgi:hypothetical protein